MGLYVAKTSENGHFLVRLGWSVQSPPDKIQTRKQTKLSFSICSPKGHPHLELIVNAVFKFVTQCLPMGV